jgi:hypothetical protein
MFPPALAIFRILPQGLRRHNGRNLRMAGLPDAKAHCAGNPRWLCTWTRAGGPSAQRAADKNIAALRPREGQGCLIPTSDF